MLYDDNIGGFFVVKLKRKNDECICCVFVVFVESEFVVRCDVFAVVGKSSSKFLTEDKDVVFD